MELTAEQRMLRDAVRGELAQTAPMERVRDAADRGDHAWLTEVERRQGWLGVGVPESLGGEGGGPVELAILAEELGRAAAPSPFLGRNGLLVPALLSVQAHDLLADVLTGETTAALMVPAGGPPVPNAVAVGDGDVLDGTIPGVLDASNASQLLVEDEGRLLVVDADDPGVRVSKRPIADRTRDLADVTFAGAQARPVHADRALVLDDLTPLASALVAADVLGAAGRMLEMTVDYVKDRQQFGQPVGSFQAVKHLAADMLVAVETARSMVYHAAWSLGAGLASAAVHASAAKALCADAGAQAADTAVSLHGAIGYTWEHDLHVFFKRVRLDAVLLGSSTLHRERVASALDLEPVVDLQPKTQQGEQS